MIRYINTAADIDTSKLSGFFDGWTSPPSSETHLEILRNSDRVWLAIDDANDTVVGYITAISDGTLSAYIPLLEVLPGYRGKGIGSDLVRRMLSELENFYMVDLMCDEDLVPFYKRFGMVRASGMMLRNYRSRSGKNRTD